MGRTLQGLMVGAAGVKGLPHWPGNAGEVLQAASMLRSGAKVHSGPRGSFGRMMAVLLVVATGLAAAEANPNPAEANPNVAANNLAANRATLVAEVEAAEPPTIPKWWGYAHTEPTILAGADLYRMLRTPAGQQLRLRFLEAIGPEISGKIERVLLSVGEDEAGRPEKLMIFSGQLQPKQMKEMALREGAVVRRLDQALVIAPPDAGPNDGHFALLDERTAMAGTWTAISAALSRYRDIGASRPTAKPSQPAGGKFPAAGATTLPAGSAAKDSYAFFARAAALAEGAEVWATAEAVPQGLLPAASDRLADESRLREMRLSVTQLPVPQMQLLFTAEPDAPEAAVAEWERLVSEGRNAAQTAGGKGAKAKAKSYLLQEWLPNLQATARPGQVVYAGLLDRRALLEKLPRLGQAMGLPVQPGLPPLQPAAPPPPPPAPLGPQVSKLLVPSTYFLQGLPGPPRHLGVVRILGLDEGEQTFVLQQ